MLESSGRIAGMSNINNLRYDILGRVGQLAYPLKQPRQPFLLQMVNKPPLLPTHVAQLAHWVSRACW